MRELIKSMLSFSWGMSLFGIRQFGNLLTSLNPNQPQNQATAAFDAVTQATEEQFDGVIREAFQAGDRLQRGMIDMMFGVLPTVQSPPTLPGSANGDLQTQPLPPQSTSVPVRPVTTPAQTIRVDSGRLNTTTFV